MIVLDQLAEPTTTIQLSVHARIFALNCEAESQWHEPWSVPSASVHNLA